MNYLTYLEGNCNLFITVPHGGNIKPKDIPVRINGTRVMDSYTRPLGRDIYDLSLKQKLQPYVLIADISRTRVDLNRDLNECCEHPKATQIWKNWDKKIKSILSKYNKMLYIDLHSHNDNDTFQLGYNLGAKSYLTLMNTKRTKSPTTLDSVCSKYEGIFGPFSIKQSLESYGFKTFIPSGKEVYFNGGRNIEDYSGNGVAGIQIECPVSVLKKDKKYVANALYYSFSKFMEKLI